jgi:hypothetical protein
MGVKEPKETFAMALPAYIHEQIAQREERLRRATANEVPPPRALREQVRLDLTPTGSVGSTTGELITAPIEELDQVQRWQERVQQVADTIRWVDDLIAHLEAAPDLTQPEREVLAHAHAGRAQAFELMQRLNPDQAWFWTQKWQTGEREVDREIAAGHLITGTPEEFEAALDAIDAELA